MYTEKQIPVKSSSDDLQMVTAAQRAGGATLREVLVHDRGALAQLRRYTRSHGSGDAAS